MWLLCSNCRKERVCLDVSGWNSEFIRMRQSKVEMGNKIWNQMVDIV